MCQSRGTSRPRARQSCPCAARVTAVSTAASISRRQSVDGSINAHTSSRRVLHFSSAPLPCRCTSLAFALARCGVLTRCLQARRTPCRASTSSQLYPGSLGCAYKYSCRYLRCLATLDRSFAAAQAPCLSPSPLVSHSPVPYVCEMACMAQVQVWHVGAIACPHSCCLPLFAVSSLFATCPGLVFWILEGKLFHPAPAPRCSDGRPEACMRGLRICQRSHPCRSS